MCLLILWEPKLVKITWVYLSDHLINIEVEKYEPSALKCRFARIFFCFFFKFAIVILKIPI